MKNLFSYNKEHMAKVVGRSLPISTKYSIEVCRVIRKKKLSEAKEILKNVIELKKAIPFVRSKRDISHQTKIGPGRFPVNASKEILSLLNGVEANAQFKGLNTSELIIVKSAADTAAGQWHYGRQRRRRMKRTNVEIIVEEAKKTVKKEVKKEAAKGDKK